MTHGPVGAVVQGEGRATRGKLAVPVPGALGARRAIDGAGVPTAGRSHPVPVPGAPTLGGGTRHPLWSRLA